MKTFLNKLFSRLNLYGINPSATADAELKKNFRIVITGSPGWAETLLGIIGESARLDVSVAEKDSRLAHYLRVEKMPSLPEEKTGKADDSFCAEEWRKIHSDLVICALKCEDIIRSEGVLLDVYREIVRFNKSAVCLIENTDNMEFREQLYEYLDRYSIHGEIWIDSPSTEEVEKHAESILDACISFGLPMGYRFPIFRDAMARKLIHRTGIQNMIIALASSLPSSLPIVGIIIGLLSVAGETTVLTANQIKLCLQLAGLYGLSANLIDRFREIWPLLGGAVGFRAIARGLAGFIPVAGPSIKGTIAYGGTYLVGETALWYYKAGRELNEDEKREIYQSAREKAIKYAGEYVEKIKKYVPSASKRTVSSLKDFSEGLTVLERQIERIERNARAVMDEKGKMREDSKTPSIDSGLPSEPDYQNNPAPEENTPTVENE